MTKIFISFLGSTPYVHCKYKWIDGKQESSPVRYVQEAIAGFLCKDWGAEDKIRIFTTKGEEGSLEKNWKKGRYFQWKDPQGNIHNDSQGEKHEKEELKEKHPKEGALGLEKRLERLKLSCDIKNVEIPDGTEENKIWEVIQEVVDEIDEKAEVYFDITHSFRFLPMIVPAIISFLKTTKKITLGGIYYGAFDILGGTSKAVGMKLDKRIAPILELKEIYEMIEWSEAVNNFVHFGDERKLVEVINNIRSYSKLDEVLEEKLTDLTERVQELGEALRLNDLWKLKEIAEKEKVSFVEDINLENNPELYPLKEIGKKIEDYLNQWKSDIVKNGFLAAKWHLENKRIAQALVFAREAAYWQVYFLLGWDKQENIEPIYKYNTIGYIIGLCSKYKEIREKNIKNFKPQGPREAIKSWFKDVAETSFYRLKKESPLVEKISKLQEWRNNISHAGSTNSYQQKNTKQQNTRQEIKQELPGIINAFLKELNLPLINEEDHA